MGEASVVAWRKLHESDMISYLAHVGLRLQIDCSEDYNMGVQE